MLLTLMIAKQSVCNTLWLMMKYPHIKSGYKSSDSLENTVRTTIQ